MNLILNLANKHLRYFQIVLWDIGYQASALVEYGSASINRTCEATNLVDITLSIFM
jgi:hypothetical protein